MANIGCRIVKDFDRPDQALIEKFAGHATANLGDCMGRVAGVHEGIVPMNKGQLLGTAFTVKVPEGDNLMFHLAMDLAKPGDVVVIDAGGATSRAILGELMVRYCRKRKLAGIVVDGSIRDLGVISQMTDFPVYAKGVTPDGPYKNGPGEVNTPVNFGGRVVFPGDIVIGDEDGIVFVRPQDAEELLEKVEAIVDNEKKIIETIEKEGTYIRPWVEKTLEALNAEYVEHEKY